MANRFKKNPISKSDMEDVQMYLDGTYADNIPCADFYRSEEETATQEIENTPVEHSYCYENEYRDKRIKDDTRAKQWIVNGILGDTETHYVQPVKTSAVFPDKHSAMECIRATIRKLNLKFGNGFIDERIDMADYVEIRFICGREYILTAQAVIPGGFLDIEKL